MELRVKDFHEAHVLVTFVLAILQILLSKVYPKPIEDIPPDCDGRNTDVLIRLVSDVFAIVPVNLVFAHEVFRIGLHILPGVP
jgi:hypothetical protein